MVLLGHEDLETMNQHTKLSPDLTNNLLMKNELCDLKRSR